MYVLDMADRILHALPSNALEYKAALSEIVGTEKIKKRPLLAKYLNKYIGEKTTDFFIHKDLGSFLKRELDFYIKNEIMHIDDIGDFASRNPFENFLIQTRVLRKIAHCLIDFLAQLENFQKNLWLKKKFIIGTQYCITLDRISSKYYAEIAKNKEQIQEWVTLLAIDKLDGFSNPLDVEFLKSNPSLPLDTAFFSSAFKDAVVSSLDLSKLNGTLVCGENSQALRLLQKKYDSSLSVIYIDPPYNTDASSIIYKNGYKSSSWLCMMKERFETAKELLAQNGVIVVAIDDVQLPELRRMMLDIFPYDLGVAVVRSNPAGRLSKNRLSTSHEYALFFAKGKEAKPASLPPTKEQEAVYPCMDEKGRFVWNNLIRNGSNRFREDGPTMYYPIVVKEDTLRIPVMKWCPEKGRLGEYIIQEELQPGETLVYPDKIENGKVIEFNWHRGWETVKERLDEYRVRYKNGKPRIDFKKRMGHNPPSTWWGKSAVASALHGSSSLKKYFGEANFDFPKAPGLVEDCIRTASDDKEATVLDYFAGSGTTPDVVINLNRCDGGNRKYIAVEMGRHFTDVMLPRVKKVIYSAQWSDGLPVHDKHEIARNDDGHVFKYSYLESYEDTINNLVTDNQRPHAEKRSSDPDNVYLINYLLEIETRGSPSLLNISSFDNPLGYKLKHKKPNSFERTEQQVDLVETFNYLIGLNAIHLGAWCHFDSKFKRINDSNLHNQKLGRMIIDGEPKKESSGCWGFRNVLGHTPTMPGDASFIEPTLIIWRTLSGDAEKDNLMLDKWFEVTCQQLPDFESIRVIYVNGSNNLTRLLPKGSSKAVLLIEEEFHKSMWEWKRG